jgi:hypothetical protein
MLMYRPADRSFLSRSTIRAGTLDDDGRRFYLRMTTDIDVVSGGLHDPGAGNRVADLLLEALLAPSAGRDAAWRRLYHGVADLVAAAPPSSVRDNLRAFLNENADIASAAVIEG